MHGLLLSFELIWSRSSSTILALFISLIYNSLIKRNLFKLMIFAPKEHLFNQQGRQHVLQLILCQLKTILFS